jgi:hypothetical protein
MTNNPKQPEADAFDALKHPNTEAVAVEASSVQEDGKEKGAVGAAPLSEENPAGDHGTLCKLVEHSPTGNHSLPDKVHWIEPHTLHAHPLSESIYGSDLPQSVLASVKEEGICSPLIVSKGKMQVISGSTRLKVAQKLNMKAVPVLFLDQQLTSEEEQDLLLKYNVTRDKTNEIRVREFKCYLEIEKGLAQHRVPVPKNDTAQVPNLAPKKSRDVAAEKVGASHSSLQNGLKAVEAIDRLTREGKFEDANRLRRVLNENGYSQAKNLAVNQCWITEEKPKLDKQSKAAAKADRAPSAVLEALPSAAPTQGASKGAEDANPKDSDPASGNATDQPVLQQVIDQQGFNKLLNAFDEIEAFLSGTDAAGLSSEQKNQIGTRIMKLNKAAACEGISLRAS